MTRNDFKLITEVIKEISPVDERYKTAMSLAVRLKNINPHFNVQKFLESCCATNHVRGG